MFFPWCIGLISFHADVGTMEWNLLMLYFLYVLGGHLLRKLYLYGSRTMVNTACGIC